MVVVGVLWVGCAVCWSVLLDVLCWSVLLDVFVLLLSVPCVVECIVEYDVLCCRE